MEKRIGIILILILIFAFVGCSTHQPEVENEAEVNKDTIMVFEEDVIQREVGLFQGDIAPPIGLENLEGEIEGLENYEGQVIFLNFWATWCNWCVYEMPDLEEFYRKNKEIAVVLSVDIAEEEEVVNEFLEKYNLTFPVLIDPVGRVANQYRIESVPTTYVIDEQGIIQYVHLGAMEKTQMEAYLQEVLNK